MPVEVWQVRNVHGLDAGCEARMAIFESEELADAWVAEMYECTNSSAVEHPKAFTKHKMVLTEA